MNLNEIVRTEELHRGKANTVYATNDEKYLELEATDRISAGNGARTGVIPDKGKANNLFSCTIFPLLEAAGIPTHFVAARSDGVSKLVKKTNPIKLEVILRNFYTGSYIKAHPEIPDMTPAEPPLVEFTLKDDALGDPRISHAEIIEKFGPAIDEVKIALMEDYTRETNTILQEFCDALGLMLVDFKVEYGWLETAQDEENLEMSIIMIDEISADTIRSRDKATGAKIDKDPFREGGSIEDVAKVYADIYARIQQYRADHDLPPIEE